MRIEFSKGGGKSSGCHICGGKDHIARNCKKRDDRNYRFSRGGGRGIIKGIKHFFFF